MKQYLSDNTMPFHILMRKSCLCLTRMNFVLSVSPPFFQPGDHGGTKTTLGREVGLSQSSEGQRSVDLNSRFPFSA